jgi:hypothetical protein
VLLLVVACAAPDQKALEEGSCDDFDNSHHVKQMLQVRQGETFEIK